MSPMPNPIWSVYVFFSITNPSCVWIFMRIEARKKNCVNCFAIHICHAYEINWTLNRHPLKNLMKKKQKFWYFLVCFNIELFRNSIEWIDLYARTLPQYNLILEHVVLFHTKKNNNKQIEFTLLRINQQSSQNSTKVSINLSVTLIRFAKDNPVNQNFSYFIHWNSN